MLDVAGNKINDGDFVITLIESKLVFGVVIVSAQLLGSMVAFIIPENGDNCYNVKVSEPKTIFKIHSEQLPISVKARMLTLSEFLK